MAWTVAIVSIVTTSTGTWITFPPFKFSKIYKFNNCSWINFLVFFHAQFEQFIAGSSDVEGS